METQIPSAEHAKRKLTRELVGSVFCWTLWVIMTIALMLFVQQYTRNIPYQDDLSLVGIMTGNQPVNAAWLWSQHNEHRPVISRLILSELTRFVKNDFQAGLYLNAMILSISAAAMLLLARKVRGSTRISDGVLPLLILSIAQTETLTISFALNLVLTGWLSYELISIACSYGSHHPGAKIARFGLILVLLPLTGGSGLVMLPPLFLWLVGTITFGWWSGQTIAKGARAIGLVFLTIAATLVVFYLRGYTRPSYHPSAPSMSAVALTTLECLSVVLCPNLGPYWMAAGLVVASIILGTLARLAIVGIRSPVDRPRAIGFIAIILGLLSMAVAVGVSRSGLGPGTGLANRYITIMTPLPCALYIAWLSFAPPRRREWICMGLLIVTGLMAPLNYRGAIQRGRAVRRIELQVEQSLKARVSGSVLVGRVCPQLFPAPDDLYHYFKMLKSARFGPFEDMVDDRIATSPEAPEVLRR